MAMKTRTCRLTALMLMLLGVAAPAQAPPDVNSALAVLKKAHPDVTWDSKVNAVADVTCDGVTDVALVGHRKDAILVAVVSGA